MRAILGTTLLLAVLSGRDEARAEQPLAPEEGRLLALVNEARAEAGLEAVTVDARLCEVARSHSRDMSEAGFFSHVSPRTGSPGDRLRAASVDFRLSGENIAIDQTIEGAHSAFMASPGHRRNVLDPELTHVGLGVVRTERGLYVTEHFVRPRPGFVATVPPASAPARIDPEPGPAAAVVEAPPLQPAPAFGWPLPAAPAAPPAAPPPFAGVWVVGPDGSWHPWPFPWPGQPQ